MGTSNSDPLELDLGLDNGLDQDACQPLTGLISFEVALDIGTQIE